MAGFDHKTIEDKWRGKWLEVGMYGPDLEKAQKPFYNLMMFPYPSAEGLHVGNMYAFTGADVYGRFQRMHGYEVFEPIGLDGFGIHSENYAIKVGRHPKEQAKVSQERFYDQLVKIGNGFAWNHRLETYDPEYYQWTQWLFTEMFTHGLAYRKTARVNWCPSCKTVLADEQVEGGVCERCKTETTFKELKQWFFRITEYADQLLSDIETLKWPEKIKTAQRNWIGKSKGLSIHFSIESTTEPITVWTKFWETVFGTTYLVVAPEYPLVQTIIERATGDRRAEIEAYVKAAREKTDTQRKQEEKEKTGVFSGEYAVNPVNGERVPVWIADYVLTDVGTGAVMGVPAHDERDFAFAKKHGLPIRQVVSYEDRAIDMAVEAGERAYEGEGSLVHSGDFNGLDAWGEGKEKMAAWMIEQGMAEWTTTYHLRDWLISRQRYWGPPIPMVFCEQCARDGKSWFDTLRTGMKHEMNTKSAQSESETILNATNSVRLPTDWDYAGWYPVRIEDLPVRLPDLQDFKPKGDGSAPLANADESWQYTSCPACGSKAKRETDVSDTFLDSAWYFLAYPNLDTNEWHRASKLEKEENLGITRGLPWKKEIISKWLPVNAYIGGAEHAVLHLLYARFVWKALRDWGTLPNEVSKAHPEPFPFLFGHGLIIKDGAKMSKSRGNVVNPDEYIERYGSDTLRTYLMFLGPYEQGGDFRDTGIAGMRRFLDRVWKMYTETNASGERVWIGKNASTRLRSVLQETIVKMERDTSTFHYNTALSAFMEFMNAWKVEGTLSLQEAKHALLLLAPFAPYLTEELWQMISSSGGQEFVQVDSVHYQAYPSADLTAISTKPLTLVVQVNGKVRANLSLSQAELEGMGDLEWQLTERAKALPEIAKWLEGVTVRRTIFVPPRQSQAILNLVVG